MRILSLTLAYTGRILELTSVLCDMKTSLQSYKETVELF